MVKKKTTFEIIGLMDNDKIKWKKLSCVCGGSTTTRYPFIECKTCRFQEGEDSMPREPFEVADSELDSKGKTIKTGVKLVNQITIIRGSLDDIQGWVF